MRERGSGSGGTVCANAGAQAKKTSKAKLAAQRVFCRVVERKNVSCRAGASRQNCSANTRRDRVGNLDAGEHGVGYARDLRHFRDFVNADDVRAAQDRSRYGSGRAPQALRDRRRRFFD